MTQTTIDIHAISEQVQRESTVVERILQEMDRVIVGQRAMVERILMGLLCNGHILLEGVPGLAKTLTVATLARIVAAQFKRIQFTPDLLPADLTGTTIYNQHQGVFIPKKGPIFAHLILADEINRAPAKVQSALLECMQERQVTIGEETYALDDPFLVMATQNPIDQEGTYPLPEAQVDRFMLKVKVDYPSRAEERLILDRMANDSVIEVEQAVSIDEIRRLREVVEIVYIDDKVKDYVVDLVQATRRAGRLRAGRHGAADRVRGLAAGRYFPRPHGARPRLHPAPRLRHPGRCQGRGSRCTQASDHRLVRGRGRGNRQRSHRATTLRPHRSSLKPRRAEP